MIFSQYWKRCRAPAGLALISLCVGCGEEPLIQKKSENQLPTVMSINACTDQLAFALADRKQIASLSHYARDKFSSPIARQADTIANNNMSAEEVLAARPDILFSSPFEKPAIGKVTKALGIKIRYFGVPSNISEAMQMVETAGLALNQNERAKYLNKQIIASTIPLNEKPIPALIYFQGGYSAGKGTLIDDIMTRAGFHNMARDYGAANWGRIDIETIISNPPELMIIADTFANGAPSERSLRHKALYAKELGIKFAHFPNQFAYCGGTAIAPMANHLKRIRSEYDKY